MSAQVLAKLERIMVGQVERTKKLEAALEEQKQQLAESGTTTTELQKKLTAIADAQIESQGEHARVMRDLKSAERQNGRTGGMGTVTGIKLMNVGRAFSQSPEYKEFHKNRKLPNSKSGSFEVKGSFFGKGRRSLYETRADDTLGDVNAGPLRIPFFAPGIVEFAKRMPIHRDWANVVATTRTDTVKVKREKQEFELVTKVAVAQTSGNNTLQLESVAGLATTEDFKEVVIRNSGGPETFDLNAIDEDTLIVTLSGNLSNNVAKGDLLTAAQFTFTKEGKLKPKSLTIYEDLTVQIETLATHIEVTNQSLEDTETLEDITNRRLLGRLARDEEKMFFYGDGVDNWLGFFTNTDIPEVLWSNQPAATTKLDFLLILGQIVALSQYQATAAFINTNTMTDLMLTKGTDKHYVFFQIMVTGAPMVIWGMQIVATTVINLDDAAVGAWSEGVTIYDRQDGQIRIGEPGNTFLRNSKVLLAEQRAALAWEVPQAFTRGRFDSQP